MLAAYAITNLNRVDSATEWGHRQLMTSSSGTVKKVSVPFLTDMKSDYSDVRFTKSDGTTWLTSDLISYDGSSALFLVTSDTAFTNLYYYWGYDQAEDYSNSHDALRTAGYWCFRPTRGIDYDVTKSRSYDYLLVGSGGTNYNAWPRACRGSSGNAYLAWKYSPVPNHGQVVGGQVHFRKKTSKNAAWGDTKIIADPGGNLAAMNVAIASLDYEGVEEVHCIYNEAEITGDPDFERGYYKRTNDQGETFTTELMVGPDSYFHPGAQMIATSNGWLICGGYNTGTDPWNNYILYSTDHGREWKYITVVSDPTDARFNEMGLFQKCEVGTRNFTNEIQATVRSEKSAIFYSYVLTMDEGTGLLSAGAITVSPLVPSAISPPTMYRDLETWDVWCFYGNGDFRGKYTRDEGATWSAEILICDLSPLAAYRPYPTPIGWGNGCTEFICCTNQLFPPENSDLYQVMYDLKLQHLRSADNNSFTTARPRPPEEVDGVASFTNQSSGVSNMGVQSLWSKNGSSEPFALLMDINFTGNGYIAGLKKDTDTYTVLNNVVMTHFVNDRAHAEEANDNFFLSVLFAPSTQYEILIEWTADLITFYRNGTLVATKTPSDGSGICDFLAQVYLFWTGTSAASINVRGLRALPIGYYAGTFDATASGSAADGNWTENAAGNGFN